MVLSHSCSLVARLLVNLTSRLIDSIEVHTVHANGQFGHYVLVDLA